MTSTLQLRFRLFASLCSIALLTSCQATPSGSARPNGEEGAAPDYDPQRAFLSIDDIEPLPPAPTTTGKPDDTSDRAQRQIDDAATMLEEQRYTEAIQRLERAVRYSPNSLAAHRMMARACLEAGHLTRAMEHAVTAVQIAPADPEIFLLLGRIHAENGDWKKVISALRMMQACPTLDPSADTARLGQFYLARGLTELGYLSAAISAYRSFLGDDDPSLAIQERRGAALAATSRLYERLGKPIEAAQALEQAAEGSHRGDWKRVAKLYTAGGAFDRAAAAALRSIADDPDGGGLAMLVSIRRQGGDDAALLADLERLAATYPHNAEIIHQLAQLYVRRNDTARGIEVLETFVGAHPDSAEAHLTLAELLSSGGRWAEALEHVVAACRDSADPLPMVDRWITALERADTLQNAYGALDRTKTGDPHQAYVIGRLASAAGHPDVAQRAYATAAAVPNPPIAVLVALGQLHLERLAWEPAADTGRRLIAQDDDDYLGHRILGLALMGLDEHKAAEEALQAAVQRNRTDIESMAALAEIYSLTGRPLKQRQQLQMIVEADPDNAEALEGLILLSAGRGRGDGIAAPLAQLKELDDQVPYQRISALLEARRSGQLKPYGTTLLKILEAHPDDLDTTLDLAQYHLVVEEDEQAEKYVRRVLAADERNNSAWQLLAGIELRRLKFDAALEIYGQLLQMHPRRYAWRRAEVMIMIDDQRFAAAIERITGLLEDPGLPSEGRGDFQYDLLMCLALEGRLEEARNLLTTWLAESPNRLTQERYLAVQRMSETPEAALPEAESWYASATKTERDERLSLLVQAYLNAQRYTDAETVIREGLANDPDSTPLVRLLAVTFSDAGETDAALELLEAALVDESEDLFVRIFQASRVQLLIEAERYDEAIRLVRRQLTSGRGEEDALRADLARILLLSNRCDEAKRELQTWEDQVKGRARRRGTSADDPSQMDDDDRLALSDVQNLLSLCYQREGQLSQAVQAQEQRWQLLPNDPGSQNDLGYQLSVLGRDISRAERLVRKAVSASPREAAYLDSLGWVLYKLGRFEEAHKWLERAARAPSPGWRQWLAAGEPQRGADDPVIQDHLGDVTWRLGRSEQAIGHWVRAGELAQQEDDPIGIEARALAASAPAKVSAAREGKEPEIAETAATEN